MAASKTIGGINVTISAKTDKFAKGVTFARKTLLAFTKSVRGFIFSMKGFATALAIGAMVKFSASQFDTIAGMGDLSDKTGVATEKLAGYLLAANEAGIANTTLEKSLTILASKGMTLSGWVKETEKLSSHQDRLNAAIGLFGKRGADMVNLVTAGSAALKEQQQFAESTGHALSRSVVAGVDRAGEAFMRFRRAVGGIFVTLTGEMAPFIEILSNRATNFLATNGGGKGIGSTIANAIIEMTKFVADSIHLMVQGVLSAISDFKGMVIQFRSSSAASAMGLGYQGAGDKARAVAGFDASRKAYGRSLAWELPSAGIDRMVADARKESEKFAQGKKSISGLLMSDPTIASLMRSGGAAAGNAKQFGGQLIQGVVQGIRSVPGWMNQAQWAGMMFAGNNMPKGMGERPSLALAESGSADSYRQQAAIRRQSEGIAKQQLAVQKQMRDGINKIADAPPMRPANFKG
jgi:hypothetical protein